METQQLNVSFSISSVAVTMIARKYPGSSWTQIVERLLFEHYRELAIEDRLMQARAARGFEIPKIYHKACSTLLQLYGGPMGGGWTSREFRDAHGRGNATTTNNLLAEFMERGIVTKHEPENRRFNPGRPASIYKFTQAADEFLEAIQIRTEIALMTPEPTAPRELLSAPTTPTAPKLSLLDLALQSKKVVPLPTEEDSLTLVTALAASNEIVEPTQAEIKSALDSVCNLWSLGLGVEE